jgi:hypothetical protein
MLRLAYAYALPCLAIPITSLPFHVYALICPCLFLPSLCLALT